MLIFLVSNTNVTLNLSRV